jgi:hypothetical protein
MLAVIIMLIINAMILKNTGTPISQVRGKTGGEWEVYGTMGCGWTRKQLDHMKSKGVKHTFIDCDKGGCDGMEAFPTSVHSSGKKVVGFDDTLA